MPIAVSATIVPLIAPLMSTPIGAGNHTPKKKSATSIPTATHWPNWTWGFARMLSGFSGRSRFPVAVANCPPLRRQAAPRHFAVAGPVPSAGAGIRPTGLEAFTDRLQPGASPWT